MLPSELPWEEKRALVRTMAKRSDMTVMEIARAIGLPHETTRLWVRKVRGATPRVPRGLGDLRLKNRKWREAGLSVEVRIQLIEEHRRAA